MKPLFITLLLLVSLVSFSSSLFAQAEDYVITNKGDTIKCSISFPLFGGSPRYQIDTTQSEIKIKGSEIKEFYVAGKKLRSKYVCLIERHAYKFLTVVEYGKISLYEDIIKMTNPMFGSGATFNGPTTTSTTNWYVAKGMDTVLLIKTTALLGGSKSARKDMLADMLKDNAVVYQQFLADNSFSFTDIRNLVHLYNTGEPYKKH